MVVRRDNELHATSVDRTLGPTKSASACFCSRLVNTVSISRMFRAVRTSIECPMADAVVALLNKRPNPTDAEIDSEITNACRCSTYHRIRQAIRLAATGNSAGGRTL